MDAQFYEIVRNPQSLASYRAWSRETWIKGGGYLTLALIAPAAVGGLMLGRALVTGSAHAGVTGGGLASLSIGAMLLALWRVNRYRKRHPWTPPA
jgi:hypothetical protein